MSTEAVRRLREIQDRLAQDASKVSTFDDLLRLRMYWADIEKAIQLDEPDGTV